jgi:hypothetical protein
LQVVLISIFLLRFALIVSLTHLLFSLGSELLLKTFIFELLIIVYALLFRFEFIPILFLALPSCFSVFSFRSELVAAVVSAPWLIFLGLFCLERLIFVILTILWPTSLGASYLQELGLTAS